MVTQNPPMRIQVLTYGFLKNRDVDQKGKNIVFSDEDSVRSYMQNYKRICMYF